MRGCTGNPRCDIWNAIMNMGDEGGFESLVRKDAGVRNGVYIYNGILTNQYLGEAFNLPFKDINLLMAAM